MADPFLAEIRIFPFNFPPTGWAFCDGQLLPISQNTGLFSLIGTFYGGDGKSTFALPNLQGNAPMHQGQGQGLSERVLGESAGAQTVTLLESELPAHSHSLQARDAFANSSDPAGRVLARPFGGGNLYRNGGAPAAMDPQAVAPAGGSLPHNNMQPYLTLSFCIALQGIFPARS